MSYATRAWFLEQPGAPLPEHTLQLDEPGPDEAIVQVLACGLCHTDLGFADGSVRPNHPLPLVLGHEVVGKVVAAGAHYQPLLGKSVIVPAVLPCGKCEYCKAGRGNACPKQKMPGNDSHGGFATHLLVPAAPLVSLDGAPAGFDPWSLAVVADAVSTAWQATLRAELHSGDVAFVIGAGGVGGFLAQIARAVGAHVVVCDVDDVRLAQAQATGVEHAVNVRGRLPRDVRKDLHGLANQWAVPSLRWRIFECSGTPEGQTLAFTLLGRAATLVQVGFTPKPVELRFSNLMAFDATVHGSWGCPPDAYPDVLQLIWDGRLRLEAGLERAPMAKINDLLTDMANHRLQRRMVLIPEA